MCLRLLFGMGLSGSMMMASSGLAQPADSISVAAKAKVPQNTVIATVPVGASAIVVSPDNNTVYVANNSSIESVVVLDATNNYAVKGTIAVPGVANYLAISPDGNTLYVAGYNYNSGIAGNVYVIATNQPTYPVVMTLAISGLPQGLAVTPDGKTLFVPYTNYSYELPGGVEMFATSNYAETPIQTGGAPFEFVIAEQGKQADLLNGIPGTGYLQFINPVTGTLSSSIAGGGQIHYAVGMTTDASGSTLYIANLGNYVTVCNAKDGKVIKQILVSPNIDDKIGLGQPAVTPDGQYLYVPLMYNYTLQKDPNQVAMFDVSTGKIVGPPIAVGLSPVWAQMAPNGDTLYVANQDGTVTVVDTTPTP
jgi:DNA-binding beta-propeller fold protein YncE